MRIRIEATDLPGRTCAAGSGFPGYTGIHVAVQRRDRRRSFSTPPAVDTAADAPPCRSARQVSLT